VVLWAPSSRRFRRRPSTENRRCRPRPEACGGGGGRA
jgi:hypothetical protein